MEKLGPFTFNEKFAAGILLLFCPVYLVCAGMLLPGGILAAQDFVAFLFWQLGWGILVLLAACAAIATVFFRPDHHRSALRMHLGRFLPLVALIVAVVLSSAVYSAIANEEMLAFANSHSEELAGNPPRAVIYRAGISDGGHAIVRSPGRNPEGFTQGIMIDLTGERIKSCKPISDSDWSCQFD